MEFDDISDEEFFRDQRDGDRQNRATMAQLDGLSELRVDTPKTPRTTEPKPPPKPKQTTRTGEKTMPNYPTIEGLDGPFYDDRTRDYYYHDRRGGSHWAEDIMVEIEAMEREQRERDYYDRQRHRDDRRPPHPHDDRPHDRFYDDRRERHYDDRPQGGSGPYSSGRASVYHRGDVRHDETAPPRAASNNAWEKRMGSEPPVEQTPRSHSTGMASGSQSANEFRWTTESMIDVTRQTEVKHEVTLAYNDGDFVSIKMADVDNVLKTIIIPKRRFPMDRSNHLIPTTSQQTYVARDVIERVRQVPPQPTYQIPNVALERNDQNELTTLEIRNMSDALTMARSKCRANNYKPTMYALTMDTTISEVLDRVIEELVPGKADAATGDEKIMEELRSVNVSLLKHFERVLPTMKLSSTPYVFRYMDNQLLRVTLEVLKNIMDIDWDLSDGFCADIAGLREALEESLGSDGVKFYEHCTEFYLRRAINLSIMDLGTDTADDIKSLVNTEKGHLMVLKSDEFNGVQGNGKLTEGLIVPETLPEIYAAVIGAHKAAESMKESIGYLYIAGQDGGLIKVMSSVPAMEQQRHELANYYIVDILE